MALLQEVPREIVESDPKRRGYRTIVAMRCPWDKHQVILAFIKTRLPTGEPTSTDTRDGRLTVSVTVIDHNNEVLERTTMAVDELIGDVQTPNAPVSVSDEDFSYGVTDLDLDHQVIVPFRSLAAHKVVTPTRWPCSQAWYLVDRAIWKRDDEQRERGIGRERK